MERDNLEVDVKKAALNLACSEVYLVKLWCVTLCKRWGGHDQNDAHFVAQIFFVCWQKWWFCLPKLHIVFIFFFSWHTSLSLNSMKLESWFSKEKKKKGGGVVFSSPSGSTPWSYLVCDYTNTCAGRKQEMLWDGRAGFIRRHIVFILAEGFQETSGFGYVLY